MKTLLLRLCALFLVLSIASGCAIGPQYLKDGHLGYNEAVRNAADTELLLNIVRMRYFDTVEFLRTNSISSQVSLSVSVGAVVGTDQGDPTSLGNGGVQWSSRPTFTFTPQRGKDLARQIMTPLPISSLSQIGNSEVAVGALWKLMVRSVNGLTNVTGRTSEEFRELIELLNRTQARGELKFGTVRLRTPLSHTLASAEVSGSDILEAAKAGYRFSRATPDGMVVLTEERPQPVLHIAKDAQERNKIFELLGLRRDQRAYVELHPGVQPEDDRHTSEYLAVDTRSVIEGIAYLAAGISPPPEHVARGWVGEKWPPLREANRQGPRDAFKIRWSRERPDAALAVSYRDRWFYLADDDQRSRLTFWLLAEIMRLALSPSEGSQQAPILTLPVGG